MDDALELLEADAGRPAGLTRLMLVLLLAERPGHGYELKARLRTVSSQLASPSRIYRALRRLEDAGFVSPLWDFSDGPGPARRIYRVTPAGTNALCSIAPALRRSLAIFEPSVAAYIRERLRRIDGPAHFPFTAVLEVDVAAADMDGARRRLAYAFQICVVSRDVRIERVIDCSPRQS